MHQLANNRQFSVMVLFAVALHYVWAALIAFDPIATRGATAINALYRHVPDSSVPYVLLFAATAALIGIFARTPLLVLLLIPQQLVLMVSAGGALDAMWLGHFADGVTRPWPFIAADQIYCILAALGHTVAIVIYANRVAEDGR